MSVDYAIEGDVAVLTINHPPVNALSLVVREGLKAGIQKGLADQNVRAIVVLGGGRTFIAGADISEFGTEKSRQGPRLQDIQRALETSPKPTVAAIHGTALGGGLEIALACHSRVAVASAKLGLPEVKLGLLPGAGGTVRTPRLIGVEAALSLVTSGDHIPAAKAHSLGLVDAIIDDLRSGGVAYARKLVAEGAPPPVIERNEKVTGVDPALFRDFREKTAKKSRGQLAPAKIIDCIEAACTKPAAEALAFETAAFQELFQSDQRKALIHYFFAEREARKIPDIPESVQPQKIGSVAVIGAGLMGGGIGMVFANAGIPVTLLDVSDEAVAKGRGIIEKNYATSVSRGSMTQARMDDALDRMRFVTKYEDIGPVDLVVEAAFEDMDLKKKIFTELDRVMPDKTILGSNTSSLNIDEIASATKRPDKVVGVHFFSPANVMKLQENVRGKATSHQTLADVMALAKDIGKVAVLAGNCDGFIGNRMLQYYTGEAEFMLEEGATPEQIDRVAESFGMAMGPLAMRDLAGMDTSVRIRAIRRKTLPPDERMTDIVERLVEAGRYGQKTGKGYYRYEGRTRIADPEAIAIIEDASRAAGVKRRAFTDEEVLYRLFFPMVNEAAKELEEGIAIRASDIDVVWVNGYGFPAHRGGPMFWAEQVGLDKVLDTSRELAPRRGVRWAPAKLLERLVAEGKGWSKA
ncbi:3-hydroxyacyl-CoA dehydrogenase NAD-binding domain-containing protein [Terricaulis silvestris]|uniref:Fatty acid oxidation complex subunit alpha n=1 Tax=Terricaulis silvestris TaxID=2686094 RepID=A0A6I6MPV8_9CAUL|nr:3-hydroxyacyl-CoA dehydrogenase NAD-binding domain-containing protein [Terricaulis silvestris]QGZ96201.1 Fatty acid oxidation complex subunit alpha [Terricaulis silvestris]